MYFTKSALIVLLFSLCCYAPIPPCSPLRFINKIVESDELAWLLRDLPGHPVRPCPYENEEDAPAEERSLIAFFFGDTNRITDELRSESEFWTFKVWEYRHMTKNLPTDIIRIFDEEFFFFQDFFYKV